MSQENVETILEAVDAFNRQDVDAFVATGSPDIEWEDSMFWSGVARVYRGRGELREWFEQVSEPWESIRVEVVEITDTANDRVFYGLQLTARGKGSGVDTEARAWAVNWFAGGKVTRRKVFRERAEALEAAGLRE